jgi:hypothetical protein
MADTQNLFETEIPGYNDVCLFATAYKYVDVES